MPTPTTDDDYPTPGETVMIISGLLAGTNHPVVEVDPDHDLVYLGVRGGWCPYLAAEVQRDPGRARREA